MGLPVPRSRSSLSAGTQRPVGGTEGLSSQEADPFVLLEVPGGALTGTQPLWLTGTKADMSAGYFRSNNYRWASLSGPCTRPLLVTCQNTPYTTVLVSSNALEATLSMSQLH